jgi:hypothetical protein
MGWFGQWLRCRVLATQTSSNPQHSIASAAATNGPLCGPVFAKAALLCRGWTEEALTSVDAVELDNGDDACSTVRVVPARDDDDGAGAEVTVGELTVVEVAGGDVTAVELAGWELAAVELVAGALGAKTSTVVVTSGVRSSPVETTRALHCTVSTAWPL